MATRDVNGNVHGSDGKFVDQAKVSAMKGPGVRPVAPPAPAGETPEQRTVRVRAANAELKVWADAMMADRRRKAEAEMAAFDDVSDTLTADAPNAWWTTVSEDGTPVALLDRDRNLIREVTDAEKIAAAADMALLNTEANAFRFSTMADGVRALPLLHKCGIDGCEFRVSPQGGPSHSTSSRCASGGRPHCTCNSCF